MPELVTKSMVQEEQERKIETRTVMKRIGGSISIALDLEFVKQA
jgi:hypothetical protein